MADRIPKFREIPVNPLDTDLGVGDVSRLLRKDVGATNRFPGEIGIGARKTGIIDVSYFGNASAGDFSTAIDLTAFNITQQPLALVWYMGTVDKTGLRYPGGGLIPGSPYDTGMVLHGAEVAVTGIANYCITKDQLTVKLTSQNVGWTAIMVGYFYYVIYYDVVADLPAGL